MMQIIPEIKNTDGSSKDPMEYEPDLTIKAKIESGCCYACA